MYEGVGMEVGREAGTSSTVVELLGMPHCGGVGDGSFVIGVSDGVTDGCGGCIGGGVRRGVKSSTTVMGIEVEEGGVGDGM